MVAIRGKSRIKTWLPLWVRASVIPPEMEKTVDEESLRGKDKFRWCWQ